MFKKSPEDVGVFSCASGCEFCKNLRTGKSITLKTGVVVRANARIECKSRNVIYIIVCGGCLEFYVGETGDIISIRFTVHRQHMKLNYVDAPVKADPHFRCCGHGKYESMKFFLSLDRNTIM